MVVSVVAKVELNPVDRSGESSGWRVGRHRRSGVGTQVGGLVGGENEWLGGVHPSFSDLFCVVVERDVAALVFGRRELCAGAAVAVSVILPIPTEWCLRCGLSNTLTPRVRRLSRRQSPPRPSVARPPNGMKAAHIRDTPPTIQSSQNMIRPVLRELDRGNTVGDCRARLEEHLHQ